MTNAVTYVITLMDMHPCHPDEAAIRCTMCDKESAIFKIEMASHRDRTVLNTWSTISVCLTCSRKLVIAYLNTAEALSYGPSAVIDLIRRNNGGGPA